MDISLPKRCLICASLLPMRGSLRSLCSLSTFLRSAGTAAPLHSAWLALTPYSPDAANRSAGRGGGAKPRPRRPYSLKPTECGAQG